MYRLEITAQNDIDLQNVKLAKFEALADTHYKNAMRNVLRPVAASVKSGSPVMSGAMRASIGSTVTGEGSNIVGRVKPGAKNWYANVVEYGRYKTNKQPPVEVIAEKFGVPTGEAFLIARAIARNDSNARKPLGLFEKGQKMADQLANVAFAAANEQIVNDLVVT